MGTLSPEALVQLYNEMLNEGRKTGFGMKNSENFILWTEAEYENRFGKIPTKVEPFALQKGLP
jgi:hypothetical protein